MKEYKMVNLLNGLVVLIIAKNKWNAMKMARKHFATSLVNVIN